MYCKYCHSIATLDQTGANDFNVPRITRDLFKISDNELANVAHLAIASNGTQILRFHGYEYLKYKTGTNSHVYWRCRMKRTGCNVRLTTFLQNDILTTKKKHHELQHSCRGEKNTAVE